MEEKKTSYLYELEKKGQEQEKRERLNKTIEELNNELNGIVDKAYQSAIGKVIAVYQDKLNNPDLSAEEREAIEQERKAFEADPSTKGVKRENSPIIDETDKKRAMQIVGMLKDTSKITFPSDEMTDEQFLDFMKGFGDRQRNK